jgi:hypothetical protein
VEAAVIRRHERRAETRQERVEDHGVLTTRIAPGQQARLIDVSASGALVDTPMRLLPGSTVEVRLATRHRRISIRGEVVRCTVARLGPIVYRGAVKFECRLPMFAGGQAIEQELPVREEVTHGLV